MKINQWRQVELVQEFLEINGQTCSIWFTQSRKPTVFMFHGLGGSHFGLCFLAKELAEDYRVVIVELPNHGKSFFTSETSFDFLHEWAEQTVQTLSERFSEPHFILAHSFGCLCLGREITQNYPVVFLNPAVGLKPLQAKTIELFTKLQPVYLLQNTRPISLLKGFILLKIKNQLNFKRICWNTYHTLISPRQNFYQARMLRLSTQPALLMNTNPQLVVSGKDDTLSPKRTLTELKEVFPNSSIQVIDGGHLLPLESPVKLTEIIKQTF